MGIFCYDRLEKLVCVLDADDSKSCPFYDAKMHQVLNGQFTIQFTVPYDHQDAQMIPQDGYVIAKDNNDNPQLFIITRIEDNHGAFATRTVFGEHASCELLDEVLQLMRFPLDTKPVEAIGSILLGTRWAVGTVNDYTPLGIPFEIRNVDKRKALSIFAEHWKGDMTFRITLSGSFTTFTRFVDWESIKGVNTGRRFEYSKDMTQVMREIDTSRIKTALIGVGGSVTVGDQPTLRCIPLSGGQFTWQITGLGSAWDDNTYLNATIFGQPFRNFTSDEPASTVSRIYPPTSGTNNFTPVTTVSGYVSGKTYTFYGGVKTQSGKWFQCSQATITLL